MRRLQEALAAAGEMVPEAAISLPRLGLAVLGPPRAASLEDLGSRLGQRVVESNDPMERAREAAACLLRLLELSAPSAIRTRSATDPARDEGSVAMARGSADGRTLSRDHAEPAPRAFDAAALRALPASPGVYRFFSEDGKLLYVGKAANLKRRVGSYFHRRFGGEPRTAAWIGLVHRIEVDVTGSEAEALMREAHAIARGAPRANRQRLVHERETRAPASLVILLQAARTRIVNAHLLRGGALLARIPLGPRGGGSSRLLDGLRRSYFEGEDACCGRENGGSGAGRHAAGPGGRRAPRPRHSGRRDAALLLSWLARQVSPAAAFDPTDAATPEDALTLALRYATSLRRGETGVVYRA